MSSSEVLRVAELEAERWPKTLERLGEGASNCRSGCVTQDHGSWGACARAANLQTQVGDGVDANRRLDTNLAEYRKARAQGLQPQSIRRTYVEATKKAAGA